MVDAAGGADEEARVEVGAGEADVGEQRSELGAGAAARGARRQLGGGLTPEALQLVSPRFVRDLIAEGNAALILVAQLVWRVVRAATQAGWPTIGPPRAPQAAHRRMPAAVHSEGELKLGFAPKPAATRLGQSIDAFLRRTKILPWDSNAAKHYATLRASLEKTGRGVGAIDLLVAAHAASAGCVLVTSDEVLRDVPTLMTEDWTIRA